MLGMLRSVKDTAVAMLLPFAVLAASATAASDVDPVFVAGNPTCQDLGYPFGLKIDPPNAGTYPIPGSNAGVTVTTDGVYFDWTSGIGIDAVIAKGGPNANVYVYDPPAESFGDTDLHSPINPNNGEPFGLSHIDFCYDKEVLVGKTAETSFKRSWEWEISKLADKGLTNQSCDPAPQLAPECALQVPQGSSVVVNYEVVVNVKAGFPVDSDWAVQGSITVTNPWTDPATLTGVSDSISGLGPVTVDCGVTFPYELAGGSALVCTYQSALPDGSDRVNTATVTTTGDIEGGSDTADVDFGDPTTKVDECVDVSDTYAGSNVTGEVCAPDSPKSFKYSRPISNAELCATGQVSNTASFVADSGATGSAEEIVYIDAEFCQTGAGCTLTQGYWKTHSKYGPAPFDDTWVNSGGNDFGEDTTFYLSGKTYYQVLWTAPAGNVYYILVHQYIAALLNIQNGAVPTQAVTDALNAANTFFTTNTPAQAAALRGPNKATWIGYATTLDQFNNGFIGPGHCSE